MTFKNHNKYIQIYEIANYPCTDAGSSGGKPAISRLQSIDFVNNPCERMRIKMELKVRVFIDNQQVELTDYKKIIICNATVDRIVNDIVDRVMQEDIPTVQRSQQ